MGELRIILKNNPDEKKKIFVTIGEKLLRSRKSSRKKLEGISKKLNLTPQMLKDIEAGKIENFPQSVHITGFLRAFAEKVNCDISLELEQLVAQDNSKNKINQNLKFTIKNSNILIIIILIFIFFISFIFIASTPKVTNNEYESRVLEKKNSQSQTDHDSDYRDYNIKENTTNINEQYEIKKFFEIIFLEETWIEVFDKNKILLENGLFRVGESMKFQFTQEDSDFYIKSGNLGGFQIFYNDEFFAPFGLSGQVTNGFFLKEKINTVKSVRILKDEY